MTNTIKNTAMPMKERLKGFGQIAIAGIILALLVGVVFVVVNAQGEDNNAKPVKEPNITIQLNDTAALLYDAQMYASHMNVSIEEAVRRFKLQNIPVPEEELRTKESETFAGLWIEHTPKFKYVVLFTRDGEETIKPYLKKYLEFAELVEVRNTAKVSLDNLRRAHDDILSSISTSNISMNSNINVFENCIEFYVKTGDYDRLENALQKTKIYDNVKDEVKIIQVEALAEDYVNIYGGLPLSTCTSGFAVKKWNWWGWIKGITTAGHCSNNQSYNGNNLPFKSENWAGSYDIQWHTAPGYTVINKIQVQSGGSTRTITAKKSRNNQNIGEYVCKYGKNTNYTCGYICSKNFNPQTQQNNVPTFILVNNTANWPVLAGPGDSGGPWFNTNTAYGTLKGGFTSGPNAGDAYYMAVNYVESGLDVTVMTS